MYTELVKLNRKLRGKLFPNLQGPEKVLWPKLFFRKLEAHSTFSTCPRAP